jgi:hypothetical protein
VRDRRASPADFPFPFLNILSVSYPTPLLTQLRNSGLVVRGLIKNKKRGIRRPLFVKFKNLLSLNLRSHSAVEPQRSDKKRDGDSK